MEEIELPYPSKGFKMEEIWIDLSKMKKIKIKAIQILGNSNSLKFWNCLSKHNVTFCVFEGIKNSTTQSYQKINFGVE